jgi:hypothetical protein
MTIAPGGRNRLRRDPGGRAVLDEPRHADQIDAGVAGKAVERRAARPGTPILAHPAGLLTLTLTPPEISAPSRPSLSGKTPPWRAFSSAGGGTRTPDTRIMIAPGECGGVHTVTGFGSEPGFQASGNGSRVRAVSVASADTLLTPAGGRLIPAELLRGGDRMATTGRGWRWARGGSQVRSLRSCARWARAISMPEIGT